jgi:hypothetical protein
LLVVEIDLFVWNGGVCLLESEQEDEDQTGSNDMDEKKRRVELKEAEVKLLARGPSFRQKVAGKSIPLEVLISPFA